MDTIGLQQVLSLSNLAEKIQQEAQHRTDLAHINIVVREKEKELEQSSANPPAEMARQAVIHQEDGEKKSLNSPRSKKRISEKETEETKTDEQNFSSQEGNIIDLFV